jgi:hypothetical protein
MTQIVINREDAYAIKGIKDSEVSKEGVLGYIWDTLS